jgi:ubiquitin C-terminal hydrolase
MTNTINSSTPPHSTPSIPRNESTLARRIVLFDKVFLLKVFDQNGCCLSMKEPGWQTIEQLFKSYTHKLEEQKKNNPKDPMEIDEISLEFEEGKTVGKENPLKQGKLSWNCNGEQRDAPLSNAQEHYNYVLQAVYEVGKASLTKGSGISGVDKKFSPPSTSSKSPAKEGTNKETTNSTPKVKNPPIGMKNTNNNCWANALIQLCRVPLLKNILSKDDHPLHPIFDSYTKIQKQNRSSPKNPPKILNEKAGEMVREQFHQLNPKSFPKTGQCDASEALNYLLASDSDSLPKIQTQRFFSSNQNTQDEFTSEPKIELPILEKSFVENFNHYFSKNLTDLYEATNAAGLQETVTHEQRKFEKDPEDLFISLKRFVKDNKGQYTKNDLSLPVPETFSIKREFIQSKDNKDDPTYEVDAFVRHVGKECSHGHYIAYTKTPEGVWFECNDDQIRPLSSKEISEALSFAYFFHFKKKDPFALD